MSTSLLPVARTAFLALLACALETTAPTLATAQTSDKLDPVAQERAASPTGRSRVIVEFTNAPDTRVITEQRGRVFRRLGRQQAQVAELDNRELARVAADARVARITVDRPVVATLARTGAATGATPARLQLGVTGLDVGVAIIDSGIASWHDDLTMSPGQAGPRNRVVHFKDFTKDSAPGSVDTPSDGYGHGTHVAGIIAGSGYDSDGRRTGIAPGANLIGLKVLDDEGHGYISDVIEALDYAVANKDALNIRIINLSVASGVVESYWSDPLTRAAKRAWDAGIVVFAAAGNLGTNENGETQYGGVTSPGNAPWVITVGASSHQGTARRSDDTIAPFSSRGPTWVDFTAKPDIVAPGVGIESLSDPNSTLAAQFSAYLVNGTQDTRNQPYLSLTGTSMAAPVVAGIAALMIEANPSLTPNAVKGILEYTAQVLPGESSLAQGAGLVNALGAVRMATFWGDLEDGVGPTSDVIEGETVPWSRHLIWNNYRVTGGVPLPGSNAWSPAVTWGAMKGPRAAPIVWGARTLDSVSGTAGRDNIVWATGGRENIVWATGGRENIVWATGGRENIVWATGGRENIVWATGGRENIVWATGGRENIVWATGGRENIVWATGGRDNIVWATGGRENIVWATGGRDNIVWATSFAENLVWANDCGGQNCPRVVWGAERNGTVWGTARSTDNIVWATGGRDNIVWATGGRDNIVWATGGRDNIVWATGAGPAQQIVWPADPDQAREAGQSEH